MTTLDAVVLGIVQGITEFVPISSSGHLIIVRELLGIATADGLGVDAILQLASCVAVILYFRKDIWTMIISALALVSRRAREREIGIEGNVMLGGIVLGTIPAVIIGYLMEPYMETVFRSVTVVAVTLIIGSILMFIAEQVWKWRTNRGVGFEPLSMSRGGFIGLFQALALLPGVSRSGATISGGLLLGLSREQAARFSFLLAVPIILGSGVKKLVDGGVAVSPQLIVGIVVSFVVSLAAIHFLLMYLRKNTLTPFIWYRLFLALILLVFLV